MSFEFRGSWVPVAPSTLAQSAGADDGADEYRVEHAIHWRVLLTEGRPDQVPSLTVSVLPIHALPETEGATLFTGVAAVARVTAGMRRTLPAVFDTRSSKVMKVPASVAWVM
jgi:hypothetical protein